MALLKMGIGVFEIEESGKRESYIYVYIYNIATHCL